MRCAKALRNLSLASMLGACSRAGEATPEVHAVGTASPALLVSASPAPSTAPAFSAAPAPSPTSTRPVTQGNLWNLAYRLALPLGYRLVRDEDRGVHRWEPSSEAGLIYEVRVRPRAAAHEGNVWRIPSCQSDELAGREGAALGEVGRVERKIAVSIQRCLPETVGEPSDRFECEARHARGYLVGTEPDVGLRICRTLAAERSPKAP